MEEKKYYLGNNDIMFKAIFCDEKNRDLLNVLLETLIGEKVNVIEIKNGELPVKNIHVKKKMLDLLCMVDKKYVHIELNLNPENHIKFRNFVYFSDVISNSVKKSESYKVNADTKYIHIDLTYKNNMNNQDFIIYKIQSENNITYVDNVEIYEYNMNKITEYFMNNDQENIDKYKYLIMLGLKSQEIKKIPVNDSLINKYEDLLDKKNGDVSLMSLFTDEEEFEKECLTHYDYGKEDGIKQGIKQGIEQGIEQSINNSVLGLLENGISKEVIMNSLNITEETFDKIIEENKK